MGICALKGTTLLAALAATLPLQAADDPPGAAVFRQNCAVCHQNAQAGGRMPDMAGLKKRTSAQIIQALESGVMQAQGGNLSAKERAEVASWLGVAAPSTGGSLNGKCSGEAAWTPEKNAAASTSWGGGPENWRYQKTGGVSAADIPKLKLRWAFAVPNASSMRSQPAVLGGRIFFGSQDGTVFALDAKTGCTHWAAKVPSQVRSGIALATVSGKTLVLAGDASAHLTALDATSGATVWSRQLDTNQYAMVTSTPLVHGGRIYVGLSSREESDAARPGYVCCTFRGSVLALNAQDGAILWKTWTIAAPPTPRAKTQKGLDALGPSGAGVWATPTLDSERNTLYVTTGDNYSDPTTDTSDALLALDPGNGKILWGKQFTKGDAFNSSCASPAKATCPDSAGPDHDFGAAAILVKLSTGKRVLLLGQKSGVMHAVDPDRKGEILWEEKVGQGGPLGGIQWGPATDGAKVYVALSDLTVPGATGGLFALQVANGERNWQTPNNFCKGRPMCRAAQSAAVTVIPGAVFSGSLDGHLRAYSAVTGAVLWDYDTNHEFQTVNGIQGSGGSLDAAGTVIADGMVFSLSGYGTFGSIPGNVLLAFAPEQ